MKKAVSLWLLLAVVGTLSAQPQCLMTARFDTTTMVIMTMPSGVETAVDDSVMLGEYGEYRLRAIVNKSDTMSLSFTLTEEVEMVNVNLSLSQSPFDTRQSVIFEVERYLAPLEGVGIVDCRYEKATDIVEPIFTVKNDSEDTLYGYWLPNYFWGWVEVLEDGVPVGKLIGRIDVNFVEGKPFGPKSSKAATIGSFRWGVRVGRDYRFHLLYYNRPQTRGARLVRETDTHRWFVSNKSWYHLTYDFYCGLEKAESH